MLCYTMKGRRRSRSEGNTRAISRVKQQGQASVISSNPHGTPPNAHTNGTRLLAGGFLFSIIGVRVCLFAKRSSEGIFALHTKSFEAIRCAILFWFEAR